MKVMKQLGDGPFLRSSLALVVMACSSGVAAMEFDVGNPDLRLRWDNTVRYNLGFRMEDQDEKIMNNPNFDESDGKFDKGDIVTNRLDLLTELDLSYRQDFGGRVSAAGWYDDAYHSPSVESNVRGFSTSYNQDRYSSEVERYTNGPSGEILDAFLWTNFSLGATPVNLKAGRHAVFWGEGLLFGAHAVSYSQAPTDAVKAVTSPGIETKEVFLPIGQVSAKAQVTDSLSVAAQYFYEWDNTRFPYGGTFFGAADPFFEGPDRLPVAPGFNLNHVSSKRGRDGENWGLMAKLNVESIETTFGAYYRQFDDYQPWLSPQINLASREYRLVYPRDVKLYGLSFSRAIATVAVGAELSYRKDGALNATGVSLLDDEGPRGDTIHFVANAVYGVPRNFIADNATLVAEFAYSHLDKVTSHEELYKGEGFAGCTDLRTPRIPASGNKSDGCSTRDYYAIAVNYTPQYVEILPSWTLDVPFTVNYGLDGNAASAGGGAEGALSWSVGAKMTYRQEHEFTVRYADTSAQEKNVLNANGDRMVNGNGNVGGTDRGWLTFTYKTSF
ncbi:DUF1302 domain-containing protein [Pseudomonas sp. JG-B]|uniref:DUF1302 domain-containing protein n=1 Tax=Pseudomonas sp. JG-B TaxID=2603214 RepID=UPI00129EC9E0|nr:DUF1302 family protein [Pseudomonas sp. JG-B]MRK19809.1 DUF1302 domain-containing protein [Pseudomonas sp. JG-B]